MSNHSNKRWALRISYTSLSIIVASPFIAVLPLFNQQAYAENYYQSKVAICHRTNSVKNPYVEIHIDKHAYDGKHKKSDKKSDHYGEHDGPTVTSRSQAKELKEQKIKWGDKYLSDVARGQSNKEQRSNDDCIVNETKPKKDEEKNKDVKHEEKKKREDKKNRDECKEDENKPKEEPKEEPKQDEKDPIVVTPTKETPSTPQVLSQATPPAQPQELAKTGVNAVVGSIIGLVIISAAGLLYRYTKPEEVKDNFDYTI